MHLHRCRTNYISYFYDMCEDTTLAGDLDVASRVRSIVPVDTPPESASLPHVAIPNREGSVVVP
jgi:hypothetical protein